jgi:hypothetical protein
VLARRSVAIIVLSLLVELPLAARDVYVLRFRGDVLGPSTCQGIEWRDSVLMYNASPDTVATVHVLGVSDGQPGAASPDTVSIPPRGIVDLDAELHGAWFPSGPGSVAISFLHLDVPSGVSIQASDEFVGYNGCLNGPPAVGSSGRVVMPVFSQVVPAGEPQVHLRTDLGQRDARTNVIVYNAGSVPAVAHVELRRTCDQSVTDERTFVVPADTTEPVGGLNKGSDDCAALSQTPWMRHTVVTVDQPSLSVVSTVRNSQTAIGGPVPTVDLSVAVSQ